MSPGARRRIVLLGCVLAAASAAVTGCGDGSRGANAGVDGGGDAGSCGLLGCVPDLSDASIGTRASSFLGGCAGGAETRCHGSNAGGLHLPDSPPNLVNVRSEEVPAFYRVLPGDPAQSYLYLKLVGDPRILGVQMPPGGPAPGASSLELVREWIEAGAPPE